MDLPETASYLTHRRDTGASISRVNSKPKHGQNTPANDGKVTEPIAEAGTRGNRERDVKLCSDGAVENSRDSVANAGKQNNEDGIGGTQPYRRR